MLMEVDVRAELQILPESLADLYKAACDQIERAAPSSRHIATTTLRWLLCAQRPMSIQEIIGAISVDHEAKVTSLTAEQIVATCRNIVVHDQDLDVLRFAHLSVQDYLESRDRFTTNENESVVAERCLDVVSATYSTLQVPGQTLQQNLDLQAYATVHWPFHYRNIEPEKVPARFEKKIFRFFFRRHDGAFTNWLSAFSQKCQTYEDDIQIKTTFPSTLSDPPTPLFVACIFGFPKVLAHLAQTSQDDLDRCNSLGQSALSLATEHGQFEIVRLLLQPSLHDDAQAALPLTWALPVEHDPEVVYYIAALQAAVASKRPEVVEMILARGRQRRDDTRLFDYALEVAAWMGDRSTVSLLLSRGADVRYPRPGPRFHLLAQAAILGMHDLAERLLDNGVDVSVLSWDGRGMSVLEYAALNNNPSIITLAMERGASVITANMVQNISAFHDAATHNHPECIQALFEGTLKSEGREEALRIINLMTSQSGETALHYAASKGYCSATSLLLDLGAAISDDKQGVSAFQAAVINGQLEVAKIFLSKPGLKELTRRASWNNSIALHSASYHGLFPGLTNPSSKEICIACNVSFANKRARVRHQKEHCEQEKEWQCRNCSPMKTFKRQDHFIQHYDKDHGLTCVEGCARQQKGLCEKHLNNARADLPKKKAWGCPCCNNCLNSFEAWTRHSTNHQVENEKVIGWSLSTMVQSLLFKQPYLADAVASLHRQGCDWNTVDWAKISDSKLQELRDALERHELPNTVQVHWDYRVLQPPEALVQYAFFLGAYGHVYLHDIPIISYNTSTVEETAEQTRAGMQSQASNELPSVGAQNQHFTPPPGYFNPANPLAYDPEGSFTTESAPVDPYPDRDGLHHQSAETRDL
jgi:ankyrin repeat protein